MQVETRDNFTQWEEAPADHTYASTDHCLNTSFAIKSISSQFLTPQDILFYTGVSVTVFDKLVVKLREVEDKMPKTLSLKNQLLLTLMRLRLGLLCADLARRFEISVASVSKIFSNTLHHLEKIMEDVVVWLPRAAVYDSMPQSFIKSGNSRTTCIFDCTEVLLERPRKLLARAQSYSPYKGSNTVKFLTVIAPNGLIMFVSDVYGGRASDKFIVRTSGVEDYLLPGDHIMADRGFKLEPHLAAQGINMNTPAFTRGRCFSYFTTICNVFFFYLLI